MIRTIIFFWLTFTVNGILWATTFTWDQSPSAGVIGYNFYEDGLKIGSTVSLTFIVKNLMANEAHSFYVTAYDQNSESNPSNTVNYTALIPSLKYLQSAIEMKMNPDSDYILEGTSDFKTWFDLKKINSSTATNTIAIDEISPYRFFRLRQDIQTPLIAQAVQVLRMTNQTMPPFPPPNVKPSFWKKLKLYLKYKPGHQANIKKGAEVMMDQNPNLITGIARPAPSTSAITSPVSRVPPK